MPTKSDLDEFTNVFPSTNPVSPARRLMILHRPQPSILFDTVLEWQTCIVALYEKQAY